MVGKKIDRRAISGHDGDIGCCKKLDGTFKGNDTGTIVKDK